MNRFPCPLGAGGGRARAVRNNCTRHDPTADASRAGPRARSSLGAQGASRRSGPPPGSRVGIQVTGSRSAIDARGRRMLLSRSLCAPICAARAGRQGVGWNGVPRWQARQRGDGPGSFAAAGACGFAEDGHPRCFLRRRPRASSYRHHADPRAGSAAAAAAAAAASAPGAAPAAALSLSNVHRFEKLRFRLMTSLAVWPPRSPVVELYRICPPER